VSVESLSSQRASAVELHSVERAVEVGSVSGIIPPAELRPYLVAAVERGISRALAEAVRDDGRTRLADPLSG
jgi:hypothetical protein